MKSRLFLSIALLVAFVMVVDAQAPRQNGGPGGRNRRRGAEAARPASSDAATTATQIPFDQAKQTGFEYVFGDAVKLDPAKVAEVKKARPGTRFWYDANNDGKIDEVWFIDTDSRHVSSGKGMTRKPILVKALPKYDIKKGDEPNFADTTFFADWNANGQVDAIIDYIDVDKDGGPDKMGQYTFGGGWVTCWWSQNYGENENVIGKDHLLWSDTNYAYNQTLNQNSTHFGGNEGFNELRIKPGMDHWEAFFENPFEFYDRDNDGVTEEVIRVVADNGRVRSMRWSFDAPNVATKDNPRCFDVSISAEGPGWKLGVPTGMDSPAFTLYFPDGVTHTETVNGKPAIKMLNRDSAAAFLQSVTWPAAVMSWVEDGNNVAPAPPEQKLAGERWEGVLNNAYTDNGELVFPAVGGPSCGPFNKRNDYINAPAGPFEYYFLPSDHRIHLKGNVDAKAGGKTRTWINVDYNYDNKSDMFYEFVDTDSNGVVDKMTLDVNGDGQVEDFWKLDEAGVRPVAWNFDSVNKAFAPVIQQEPARVYNLNMVLAAALEKGKAGSGADDVWKLIENKFESATTTGTLPRKLLMRDESMLYFMRLAADRRVYALKQQAQGNSDFLARLGEVRASGNTDALAKLVRKQFKVKAPKLSYDKWLAALRSEPERPRVAWDDTWLPPNVGWEAEQEAAYRMYYGHFDCFGKSRPVLCYPIITQPRKPGSGSYHETQAWGMDCLHVGNTCGIGGLTLWINGKPYPVYKPESQKDGPAFAWHKGPIEMTKDKLTMECVVTNVGPADAPFTVRLRPQAIAGRPDSPIEVKITGGKRGDKVEVGVGLAAVSGGKPAGGRTLVLDEKAGVMGLRMWQDPAIGWTGIGVVFPAKRFIRHEQVMPGMQEYAVLKYKVGETFTYSIRADWVRGHRFPVFPSPGDFGDMLRETAKVAKY